MTKRYRCPECNKPVIDPVYINKEDCGHILCLKCGERNALTWKPCPGDFFPSDTLRSGRSKLQPAIFSRFRIKSTKIICKRILYQSNDNIRFNYEIF